MLTLVVGWLALVTVAPALPGAQRWSLSHSMVGAGAASLVAEQAPAQQGTNQPAPVVVAPGAPQTAFDCELPIGQQWYGSRGRCLAYLCEGQNVYNEYMFDANGRRWKNPCYGQSPTEFPAE
jgi:hypothetical protein